MKYLYYKSKNGNFGDDLNNWLWPKLFGSVDSGTDCLIGIGSILFNENESFHKYKEINKIVFGTGIRPSKTKFIIDKTWDIKFLRGPLSALEFDSDFDYISDGAYAVRQTASFQTYMDEQKKYEIGLMPYFKSVDLVNWKEICKKLGFHYISPLSEKGVDFTIKEISSCKKLITEAMHGAIVADLLRVPWHRFILSTPYTEGTQISEFKWNDWLQSINICNPLSTYVPLYRKTFLHFWLKRLTLNIVSVEFQLKSSIKQNLINNLAKVDKYYLSTDGVVQIIDKKIAKKINEVKLQLENESVKSTGGLWEKQ